MVVAETLPSGLRLVTEPMPHVRSVTVGIWLARGSRHESDSESGVAHFVEHMLFKGTTSRTARDIAQTIDSIGGQLDAFTAKEYASYYVKVLDDHLPLALDLLSDLVMRPALAPADVAREQSVILEEIKMVEDAPDDLVHELFAKQFWSRHPLGRPILGTPETVAALTADELRKYFTTTYVAPHFVVAAAGHFEHARMRELVERSFANMPSVAPVGVTAPPAVTPGVISRVKDIEQSHLCIGTPAYHQAHPDRHAIYVMNTILGGSMSSRLFQHIREERGLAYAVFSHLTTYTDAGMLTVYAGCATEKVDEVIDLTLHELRTLRDAEVPAEELRRAKDHLKGSLMLGLESTSSRMSHLARQELFFHRHVTLDEMLANIEAVNADDVQRVARDLFVAGRLAATMVGPESSIQLSADRLRSRLGAMIPRYTHPEMGAIWSEATKYQTWLDVELAATDVLAAAGVVPAADARTLREKASFDIGRIDAIEQTTQHDVIAFTTAVAERVGPAARWLHFGLTSSDVLDTALALQMRQGCDLLLKDVDVLAVAIQTRAEEHRKTPMIGRTHGVHAEPMTFGVKLALWHAELARDRERLVRAREVVSVGKLSGAVGMFAHLDPAVEAAVCRQLGLTPAPVSSQVVQRDRHAELMTSLAILAASLEKWALEIRGLQKTEIGEVEEPFGRGQKGSSAMPHKRNPIGCEQVVGLARLIRANAMAALENVALWHERDISHSSVERVILPDSFIALDHMLRRFTKIVAGMVVNTDRMTENLQRSRGVVFSGSVLLELAKRGVSREQAYEMVQRNAMRSFAEQRDFKALLVADADVTKVLPREALDEAFDLNAQLRNVDAIFARVFTRAGQLTPAGAS